MPEETLLTAPQANTVAEDASTGEGEASSQETNETTGAPPTETKSEETPSEPQSTEKQAAKPVVPEKYDISLPEDARLKETGVEAVATLSRELELPNESAQKIADHVEQAIATHVEAQNQWWTERSESWKEEIRADEEFGGTKLDGTLKEASKVLQRFGDEPLVKFLDESGTGNNPSLIRILARIGRVMGEDSFVRGDKSTKVDRSPEEVLYPNQGKEE